MFDNSFTIFNFRPSNWLFCVYRNLRITIFYTFFFFILIHLVVFLFLIKNFFVYKIKYTNNVSQRTYLFPLCLPFHILNQFVADTYIYIYKT